MEIFQRIQHVGRLLDFIEYDKGGTFGDRKSDDELKIVQNPGHVLGRFEELPVFRMFIEIEIGNSFIISTAKLLEQPSFPHLSNPLEDHGLAIR
jgi:hypothetical protein